MTTPTNRDPVDLLGEVKAQIAALQLVEKDLRDQVAARGPGAYEGETFRATVSVAEVGRLDMKAAKEKLSRQFIAANTHYSEVTTVKVVARTGVNVAA
jgi:hypothetical protein